MLIKCKENEFTQITIIFPELYNNIEERNYKWS